jgi:hypothetical protein
LDLSAWIDRLFPDADRGERLKRALEDWFGDDARAVADELCREVEAIAHEFSRHFALEYLADASLVPDTAPPGWPPQDPHQLRLRAGSGRRGQATSRRRGRAFHVTGSEGAGCSNASGLPPRAIGGRPAQETRGGG